MTIEEINNNNNNKDDGCRMKKCTKYLIKDPHNMEQQLELWSKDYKKTRFQLTSTRTHHLHFFGPSFSLYKVDYDIMGHELSQVS